MTPTGFLSMLVYLFEQRKNGRIRSRRHGTIAERPRCHHGRVGTAARGRQSAGRQRHHRRHQQARPATVSMSSCHGCSARSRRLGDRARRRRWSRHVRRRLQVRRMRRRGRMRMGWRLHPMRMRWLRMRWSLHMRMGMGMRMGMRMRRCLLQGQSVVRASRHECSRRARPTIAGRGGARTRILGCGAQRRRTRAAAIRKQGAHDARCRRTSTAA